MIDNNAAIQQAQVSPNSNALNAEHYQTYEIALANDDILAGNDIAQIRSYAAYARAQAQAIHKTIAATKGIEDVAAIKEEATETAQTFAKVGIYADQRIGELLRELPTKQGKRTDTTLSATQDEVTKRQAMSDAGISKSQAYDLQAMAANPEVVQAVLDKATEEGRVVSRKQVLDAIKRQKRAEQERDEARKEAEKYGKELGDAQREICALEIENDKLYERASEAKEPKVVTREVIPEATKRRIRELEQDNDRHASDYEKLRHRYEEVKSELSNAQRRVSEGSKVNETTLNVRCLIYDIEQTVRLFGGIAWNKQHLLELDDATRDELARTSNELAKLVNSLVGES